MKKYFVSIITIIAFIYYSLYQRAFGAQTVPVVPTVTPQDTPTAISVSPTPTSKSNSLYKDGTFTGDSADAFYGFIQVQAIISGGKITDIKFLQAPSDRSKSIEINSQAGPMLTQETIQAQSAQVDIISGATDSSNAFIQSLQSALSKAKN